MGEGAHQDTAELRPEKPEARKVNDDRLNKFKSPASIYHRRPERRNKLAAPGKASSEAELSRQLDDGLV
jgi:hypothetical protein